MPQSSDYAARLNFRLGELRRRFSTPVHIYDEIGIRQTQLALNQAFAGQRFRQFFAVKALPNPAILRLLREAGSGFDCSSPVELELAGLAGADGSEIMFTPNNIPGAEYDQAIGLGAFVTLDDPAALAQLKQLPEIVSFRVGPAESGGSALMGSAAHTKFGVPVEQIEAAYDQAAAMGARRFAIHSMTVANQLALDNYQAAAWALAGIAGRISARLGRPFEYINFGGGPGIPYSPGDIAFDMKGYAASLIKATRHFFPENPPAIFLECGRCITGPHGVLAVSVVSKARKHELVVGVDAAMSSLMRPAMYPGAYHHISNPLSKAAQVSVDIVGPLCENNDKFGIDRVLPEPELNDVLLIHDTGAHGHAMGFTYNGRLRPAELLLSQDGGLIEIRRRESFADYTATLTERRLAWAEAGALAGAA